MKALGGITLRLTGRVDAEELAAQMLEMEAFYLKRIEALETELRQLQWASALASAWHREGHCSAEVEERVSLRERDY